MTRLWMWACLLNLHLCPASLAVLADELDRTRREGGGLEIIDEVRSPAP
ncbi:hypothetical protein AGRA3207_002786 [Actinomadura graeca]|uniref:Uncharacterized protein n=1 Tax=Actinomadura graeca TaxID=2750812 RepID=A0ABX8QSR2_9ACTN|nr:hypothetical protein [Actinomadura graeca]QXJ21880.1 hypothetical protein AGRA3207_002786 [Actinomadura graeca]